MILVDHEVDHPPTSQSRQLRMHCVKTQLCYLRCFKRICAGSTPDSDANCPSTIEQALPHERDVVIAVGSEGEMGWLEGSPRDGTPCESSINIAVVCTNKPALYRLAELFELAEALESERKRHLRATIVDDVAALAHREGAQVADLEVVVVGRSWQCALSRHHRRRAVQAHHPLADAQLARFHEAAVRRQPRMLGSGVDRLVRGTGGGAASTHNRLAGGALALPRIPCLLGNLLISRRGAQAVRGQLCL